MKLLMKLIRNNSGFTLIEAIISVVIIGIAIVPISLVFTRTINTTVATRKQLVANEIAEKYMEALKDKRFDEYNNIFHDGTVELEGVVDSLIDLDDVPDGFKVNVSYDNDSLMVDGFDTQIPNAVSPVDGIIKIPSASTQNIEYWFDGTTEYSDLDEDSPAAGKNREIRIVGSRSDDSLSVYHYDHNGLMCHKFIINTPLTYALRFEIGDSGTFGDINTTINVSSDLHDQISLYFYESDSNPIHAVVNVEKGYVDISRNLYLIDVKEPRITELTIDVTDTLSGELLATMVSSKINE